MRAENSYALDYVPKLNVSTELESDIASCFQYLTGMLRMIVKIGKVDVIVEISMFLSLPFPIEGCLEGALHVMSPL